MNTTSFRLKFAKLFFVFAVFGFSVLTSFLTVNGQTSNFAQFFQVTGGQEFVFTNNTTSGSFNTVSGGSQVFFLYQNIGGLPTELQGIQNATVTISSTTTTAASNSGGTLTQPLNQFVTVRIIRNAATPVGVGTGSRRNLLTAVFAPSINTPAISGDGSGSSANLQASTPDHIVSYSSDFINFGLTTQRNLAFSFSAINPSLALDGSFLRSFTSAASGTFASNPAPTYAPPTAASVSVNGRVLSTNGSGLRNAQVTLTEANGTTHQMNTGSFGNYEFTGIEGGQTVTISVVSRRYSFNSQVVSLEENVTDLNFYADF